MHHTDGFETREEALQNIKDELAPKLEGSKVCVDHDFDWDGEGIPALVGETPPFARKPNTSEA